MKEAKHKPAAFINEIAESGTKSEAIAHLQDTWNKLCDQSTKLGSANVRIADLERKLSEAQQTLDARAVAIANYEQQLSEALASFEASQSRAADTIEKLEQQNAELREACSVALGHLTGGMDGVWLEEDPIDVLRNALDKANSGADYKRTTTEGKGNDDN